MAKQQLRRGDLSVQGRSEVELTAYHLGLLKLDPIPGYGWSLLIVVSFIGWISGTIFTIRKGLREDLTVVKGPFLQGTLMTISLLTLWLFALYKA